MKLILFLLLGLVCVSLWAAEEKPEQYYLDRIPFDDNHIPPGLEERLYSEEQAMFLKDAVELAPDAKDVLPPKVELPLPQSLSK